MAPAEASSNLARYDGVRYGLRVPGQDIIDMYEKTRSDGFGEEVRRRVMIGTYVLSAGYYDAYYLRAQKVRTLIKKDFEDCFKAGVHAMLTPATPSAAFGLGEKGGADPVEMYLNDVFTVTVNMAGLPGIAVPAGLDGQGLPLGLQLIGRPFDEETLFSLGAVIEQAAGHVSSATLVVKRGLTRSDEETGGRSWSPWMVFLPPSSPPLRMKTAARTATTPPTMMPNVPLLFLSMTIFQRPRRDRVPIARGHALRIRQKSSQNWGHFEEMHTHELAVRTKQRCANVRAARSIAEGSARPPRRARWQHRGRWLRKSVHEECADQRGGDEGFEQQR